MSRFERDWERELDRRLRALPGARAPRSLLPRVLAAVESRRRLPAWLARWYALPTPVRAASTFAAAVLAALALREGFFALREGYAASLGPTIAAALAQAGRHGADAAASLWWTWRLPLGAAAMASAAACAGAVAGIGALTRPSARTI